MASTMQQSRPRSAADRAATVAVRPTDLRVAAVAVLSGLLLVLAGVLQAVQGAVSTGSVLLVAGLIAADVLVLALLVVTRRRHP